jgi:mitochondrial import receptor subunit TOM20
MSLRSLDDPLKVTYCSKACLTKASSESRDLLFGIDPPLPSLPSMTSMSEVAKQERSKAQEQLAASMSSGRATLLLVARFIGRQVTSEMTKLAADRSGTTPITASRGASSEGYSLYDHIERLRYLELSIPHEEVQLISRVLETALPGLEQFVTAERYTTLKGKMAYNAIGVCYGGGRDDKVSYAVMTDPACHPTLLTACTYIET